LKVEGDTLMKEGDIKKAMRGLTLSAQFNEEDSGTHFWRLVEKEAVGVEAVDVAEAMKEYLKSV